MTNLKRGHKMKLFIPTIGTKIKLLKDWKFKLYYERRNDSLLKAQGFIDREQPMKWIDGYGRINFDTSLPAGTQLTVESIFERAAKILIQFHFGLELNQKELGYKAE
jgi:hypothetical protein